MQELLYLVAWNHFCWCRQRNNAQVKVLQHATCIPSGFEMCIQWNLVIVVILRPARNGRGGLLTQVEMYTKSSIELGAPGYYREVTCLYSDHCNQVILDINTELQKKKKKINVI